MGDYTRLTMWAEVKQDNPAVDVLAQMVKGAGPIIKAPDHKLFTLPRSAFMLRGVSAYHNTGQTLVRHEFQRWNLNIDCSFKNYDGELDAFLDWFSTVDDTNVYDDLQHAGFYRFEYDIHPTLIYRVGKGQPYKLVEVDGQPES